MSTRSYIAIEKKDKSIERIYCHWDGYLEYNGRILNDYYKDINKIRKLINLGDISSLNEEVEPTGEHSFENPQERVTVAYGRDRGEENTKKQVFKNYEEFINGLENTWCEYLYLFKESENKWYYSEIPYTNYREIVLKDLSLSLSNLPIEN